MRLPRSAVLGLIASLVLASAATAADHRMHVTEVDPVASNPSMAFVELQDAAGESFPSASYTLASLDASGTVLGQQVFTPPYGFAFNAQPFLVAAAGRPNRDAMLTIPLGGARKVCFYRGPGTADPIHCLTFSAPAAGQSAQLTSSESVVLACPTPDAPNAQSAGSCGGTSMPPATVTPDTRAPELRVSVRKVQRRSRVRIGVLADERGTVAVTGSARAAGRSFGLVPVRRTIEPGVRATYGLKLSGAGRAAVRRATDRGLRPSLKVKVVVRDAAGNAEVGHATIRLTA